MSRRSLQLRQLSRSIPSGGVAPLGRPAEAPTAMQCTPQEPTWEDLLGRR